MKDAKIGGIVWVFGSSGAGKETFLKYFSKHRLKHVAKALSWSDKKIRYCKESVDWVSISFTDSMNEKRMALPDLISKRVKPNEVLLVKGQNSDLNNGSLFQTKFLLPEYNHQIIFLEGSLSELYKRCQTKVWWQSDYGIDQAFQWRNEHIRLLQRSIDHFPTLYLNSNDFNYSLIGFSPPKEDIVKDRLLLSGWAMREWDISDLESYLTKFKPKFIEMSKDFFQKDNSIKKSKKVLDAYSKQNQCSLSYAGTTDFTNCSGFAFREYLNYLDIQTAQAKFLGAAYFRILIGGQFDQCESDVFERISIVSERIKPLKTLIEIHKGWESSQANISRMLNKTNIDFIIDFQNLLDSGLSFKSVKQLVESGRIAYFHTRNLDEFYIEHDSSTREEKLWITNFPKIPILWEPKKIFNREIIELFYEYKTSY